MYVCNVNRAYSDVRLVFHRLYRCAELVALYRRHGFDWTAVVAAAATPFHPLHPRLRVASSPSLPPRYVIQRKAITFTRC